MGICQRIKGDISRLPIPESFTGVGDYLSIPVVDINVHLRRCHDCSQHLLEKCLSKKDTVVTPEMLGFAIRRELGCLTDEELTEIAKYHGMDPSLTPQRIIPMVQHLYSHVLCDLRSRLARKNDQLRLVNLANLKLPPLTLTSV